MNGIVLADPHAEEQLIGVLLAERGAPITAIGMGLTRDDFAWDINATVFGAIQTITDGGGIADLTTTTSYLDSSGYLDVIGGRAYIEKVCSSDYDPLLLSQYVSIIKDRSMRRRINDATSEIVNVLHSEPEGKAVIDRVQKSLWRAVDPYLSTAYTGISSHDLKSIYLAMGGGVDRIPYAYRTLNAVNKGRTRGSLTITGGYTSDGKSTIGQIEAMNAASLGFKTAFFGLEMTDEEMLMRMLTMRTGIPTYKLEKHSLDSDETLVVEQAFDEISKWPLTMYCDPDMSPADIRAIQMRERYDLSVIDYLQRFQFTEFRELVSITKDFKNLALSTKTCIDLLSQCTPKPIAPGDNPFMKPDNNSLYGGKAIAHEGNNVHYIWAERQPDEHGSWQRTGGGQLYVAKARGGRADWSVAVAWDEDTLTWRET